MNWFMSHHRDVMVAPVDALPGTRHPDFDVPATHFVLGTPMAGPLPPETETIFFGMGCFWGAERLFWQLRGVYSTAVGYQGGYTQNPSYEQVCTGRTGHAEVVRVVYFPDQISRREILRVFWEHHDPTQGYRQGNDVGTQYRSAIYWTTPEQSDIVEQTRNSYQSALTSAGLGQITTQTRTAQGLPFYFAEPDHQQYLARNPHGYDCASATGIRLPG